MTEIKPIETHYKGYRFRSRLEARWAVFFDAMGFDWEYEKEGYETPYGRYLPDFWLPIDIDKHNWGYFIEIKGSPPSKKERMQMSYVCKSTKHSFRIFIGNIGEHYHTFLHRDRSHEEFINSPEYQECTYNIVPGGLRYLELMALSCSIGRISGIAEESIIKARSARFEYGECG